MIPSFPDFKKLTKEDKKDIESYTKKYLPYSDFNFTSLWVWDITRERMVSDLNGNLVVRFTDYATHKAFFSFLGDKKPNETARELLKFSEKSGVGDTLYLVPEESIKNLDQNKLKIEEDRNNFDYIISVKNLADLKGILFKSKRHSAEKFSKNYKEASFEIKKLSDSKIKEHIFSAIRKWERNKKLTNKGTELEHEEMAIKRLLENLNNQELIVGCVFIKEEMIGFSIDEKLPNEYAISHFTKADITHNGVYDFLNRELSKYLLQNKIALWNWEQDLGIHNIRKSKESYRPTNFLKKYKVSLIKEKRL